MFYKKYGKRMMDFIIAFIALVILSPVLLIVSILVRIKLGKPIIFMQERPGLNEEIFTMYKFRTMTDERDLNGDLMPDDIRLTQFGKVLRSTSVDELPELWNVIKGDMSLIGPRPLLVEYLSLYNQHQRQRHAVLPGISGLAQVNGRNSISWEAKFDLDVEYINSMSFVNDLKIVISTIKKVTMKEGINSSTAATKETFKGSM